MFPLPWEGELHRRRVPRWREQPAPLEFADTYFVYDGTGSPLPLAGEGLGVRAAGTEYLLDAVGQIVLQFEDDAQADPQLTHRYLWGPAVDQILADEQVTSLTTPGEILWPLADHLGTVRDLAQHDAGTGTTTVANHRVFNAFGQLTSETNGAIDHLFAFTGRALDESTGLQNNLNRWYDAKLGRWLSQDPIDFVGGDPNLYRYVGSQPTLLTDPSGLEPPNEPGWYWGGGWNPMNWVRALGYYPTKAICDWSRGNLSKSARLTAEYRKLQWKTQQFDGGAAADQLRRDVRERNRHPVPPEWANVIELLEMAAASSYGEAFGFVRPSGGTLPGPSRYAPARASTKVTRVGEAAKRHLGPNYRVITNRAGDKVFLSADGTRRIRFDIKRPAPRKNPHMHVEGLVHGKWRGRRIHPTDLAPE